VGIAHAADIPSGVVGIFISREILPYMEMVKALEKDLKQPSVRILLDGGGKPYSQESRYQELRPGDFSVMVTVGPEALDYLLEHHWPGRILYAMVLNPDRFPWHPEQSPCGISLNIDPWRQLITVNRVFPEIKRLGVIFNPEKNRGWFRQAKAVMTLKQMSLAALEVKRRADIPALFAPPGPEVDAILFIPDQTVISRSTISYVIKESLRLGIPTFGFNRFFHDSGAALSFIIDYEEIGRRLAGMVHAVVTDNTCTPAGPPFTVWLNDKVIKTLKLNPAVAEGMVVE
jgi:putative ABC transport system substrate-binding protein